MKISQVTTLLLVVFLSTVSLFAKDKVVLTNGEWEPFLSAKYKGYGVASVLVKEAFKQENIKVEYKFYPWKRAMYYVEKNQKDGSVIWAKSKERTKRFLFSKKPVMSLDTVFFHLKEKKFKWRGDINVFKNVKLGTTLGYQYGVKLNKAIKNGTIKVDVAPKNLNSFKKLIRHRMDVFICDKNVGLSLIKKHFSKVDQKKFTYSKRPFKSISYYLIMNKKRKIMMKKFDKGFAKLKRSGKYRKIMNEFRNGKYGKK